LKTNPSIIFNQVIVNLISFEFFLLPSLISRSSSLWIWPWSYRVNCYIAHSCTCELKQADHKKRSSNFGAVVGELASKGNKFIFDYWKRKKIHINKKIKWLVLPPKKKFDLNFSDIGLWTGLLIIGFWLVQPFFFYCLF
jgi:hypothetical protein